MAPIYHIVSFKTASSAGLSKLTTGFMGLAKTCVKPDSGETYIKSIRGGKNISIEGLDHGMQVIFVMEFENEEDLGYYISHDPAHDEFKAKVKAEYEVQGVVAMDFMDGSY